ncbi:hypothetical protein FA15DRAFT_671981 [Coprinopsis marcescibilis]|uniref:DUF4470 domain-containing protein n=1 Tax=Coprinopsis marcescibilis TaxID=230819 RepID=A0A5C3KNL3_COPMA|nr:hypothetical protein FA15DRAFT_671981 [Coprinopsis marcescibilis]
MAEALNEKGNKAYKSGNLLLAKEHYQKAFKNGGSEPKFASNLSAVLFELGQYSDALDNIAHAWRILQKKEMLESSPLAPRLATRFAKALHYARSNGVKNPEVYDDIRTYVDRHVETAVDDEMAQWWSRIKEAVPRQSTDGHFRRAINTPIYKSRLNTTLELFYFGNDGIRSLLDGVDDSTAVKSTALDNAEKQKISLLFGGAGDARNVFGTILHAGSTESDSFKNDWHMTLVEIQPTTVAKILMLFELLHDVEQARSEEDKEEAFATLIFTFKAILIPAYCERRFQNAASSLSVKLGRSSVDGHVHVFPFLTVSLTTAASVKGILERWCRPLKKSAGMLISRIPHNLDSDGKIEKSNQFDACIDRRRFVPHQHFDYEQEVYREIHSILPPPSLLYRHPKIKKLISNRELQPDAVYEAREEVLNSWEPNPTLFHSDEATCCEYEYPVEIYYHPQDNLGELHRFSLRFYRSFLPADSSSLMQMSMRTTFTVLKTFFGFVLSSVKKLVGSKRLTIEVVLEDVITGLPRILKSQRPSSYPTKFTRMWLSNVPDYTGGVLNSAILLLPYLHRSPSGLIMSNSLLNRTAFAGPNDMTYNYSMITDRELPRYLGCRQMAISEDGLPGHWGTIALAPHVRTDKAQAHISKAELHTWLSSILLSIIKGSKPLRPPRRVDQPNTLAILAHLLGYLYSHMSIPAHWLSDFISDFVKNTLRTTPVPYNGILPIPISHSDKRLAAPAQVNLLPWLHDFQLVLSDLQALLSFSLPFDLPADFILATQDVVHLKAAIGPYSGSRSPNHDGNASLFKPVIGLAFFKLKPGVYIEHVIDHEGTMKLLRSGNSETEYGSIQIMMSYAKVDWFIVREAIEMKGVGKVSWRMGRAWYNRMRKERWSMVLFQMDSGRTVTDPVDAMCWDTLTSFSFDMCAAWTEYE